MSPTRCRLGALALALFILPSSLVLARQAPTRFPADKATNVNPDTHLILTFSSPPTVGSSGKVLIFDAADNKLVDTLDLSIPPGPGVATGGQPITTSTFSSRGGAAPATRGGPPATAGAGGPGSGAAGARGPVATYTPTPYTYNSPIHATNANTVPGTPSGVAVATPNTYQLTIIGGFSDAFHFYPIIVRGNTATIYPHNNLLKYNKTYYVQIDPGVLTVADGSFTGVAGTTGWTFSTKKSAPAAHATRLVVSGDGSGDFNTVQGAIDFTPDHSAKRITIFIKNGEYEEIVYFRNKNNLTIIGEDREKTHVYYANSETLNPHPANVLTNEWPGTFPSRRAAFTVDNCDGIHLVNFLIETLVFGQAEGLLMTGKENILSHMGVIGTGDGIQLNGAIYLNNVHFTGAGDSILGRGATFWEDCEVRSNGVYMWIRNTDASHGNVFLNCKFETPNGGSASLARAPLNGGRAYPNAEVVLINCTLAGISPEGFGPIGGDTSQMHLWEYNSTNVSDGKPVDVSRRLAASKQLDKVKDAQTIANYSNPAFVLGFTPTMAPAILAQPDAVKAAAGQSATFTAKVAAYPAPTYQWFKNGAAISGATSATLKIDSVQTADAGSYNFTATNASGATTSDKAALTVN
jgi:pectinesterase